MKLVVSILNYNVATNTLRLLECLRNQTDQDFKIVVVDNDSSDREQLKQGIPTEVNLIFNKNTGYAGGNNRALSAAFAPGRAGEHADWVLILNPDITVEREFISQLKENLCDKKGLIGVAIKENNEVVYGGRLDWLKAELTHTHDYGMADYVVGGAMLVSKELYNRIGGIDEHYFLYFEDADYSLAAKKRGFDVKYLPAPIAEHAVSQSTKALGSDHLLRYHYRNSLYFNVKNGPWLIKAAVIPWSVLIILKQAIKISLGIHRETSIAILRGVLDFYSGQMGKLSA